MKQSFLTTSILLILIFNMTCRNVCAQSSDKHFILQSATLTAKDVKLSATWYRKYLNLTIKEYKPQKSVKMEQGEFQLMIIQGKNVLLSSQIKLPAGKKHINGIDKIGFSCNQFKTLYDNLKESKQKIIEEITEDENLKLTYFVTQDPDGNKIQIFDKSTEEDEMKNDAMFFALLSSDYINTMKWYESNINFSEMEVIDNSKIHFQNLLIKDQVIFEIIHLPYVSVETTEFMPLDRDLASISQLTFQSNKGEKATFKMDNNANKIEWKR